MTTWTWDELSGEIEPGPAANPEGWPLTKTHANGVREYRSSRGHLALEAEADDPEDANDLFAAVSEEYVEQMRGFDPC